MVHKKKSVSLPGKKGSGNCVDPRHLSNGFEIPTESYSDQPFIVKTLDGAWLCILTTGSGHEGQAGQHIVTSRSTDMGRTWSKPVRLEPPSGPEASYAVLLRIPSGRIFAFYNHNTDNVRKVKADNPPYEDGYCRRVDSLGYFVFKYSDDHGRSWSKKRYPLDVREMEIDRNNADGGKLRYFWNVGRPFIAKRAGFVSLHKVGGFGEGFFTRSEGVLIKSSTLLSETDPRKITWETLPDGDRGLRSPKGGGPIAEEHSYTVLSDGSFYCVYRTIDGSPACAYSRDGGHSWSSPQYKRYGNGRQIRHPRAANFVWRCRNGKYLYWFHNHGGDWYEDRNPVWLSGGVEVDSPKGKVIEWSQPEVILYEDDPEIQMSYPDMVEERGQVFLTETQKDIARVHVMDKELLKGLWNRERAKGIVKDGLVLSRKFQKTGSKSIGMLRLPLFLERDATEPDFRNKDLRKGFTIDLSFQLDSLKRNQILLDSRTSTGQGFALQTTENKTLEIILNDGRTENRWESDRGMLTTKQKQHVSIIVDGGPKLITFIIDGIPCGGSGQRQFGWGRFSPHLRHANGSRNLLIGPSLKGTVFSVRIYDRFLRTAEAIANFQALNR
ncbi:MAG: exo-alpha-sialidase [Opitutaceae bacterium]|nr:exo-alpha-sialidase [Opitutaceae bacterium]